MDVSTIEVSVICIAYNHRKYIQKALDGIVAQKTDFPFEIIVHDDMSTDGTAEIIRQYEKEYPDLIRAIYESENQYSKGKDVFRELSLPYAKGRYVASCECDDFWMDNEKLQKQYELMEAHPELDMCACRASEVSDYDAIELREIRPKMQNSILTVEEVILGGGTYLATASLFYRKSIFNSLMNYEKILFFDYSMQIKGALRGGIIYLDDKMAAYRVGTEGSWSTDISKNKEKWKTHYEKEIRMLRELDQETKGIYHDTIEKRISVYGPLSFYEQLIKQKDSIKAELRGILKPNGKVYLWGLGIRGEDFQKFCWNENINLDGVCDWRDVSIGEKTAYGFSIYETNYVFENSDVILAANTNIYHTLVKKGYKGHLVDLQKYMS